jgi:sporulation protein YlmC with PRC-barrel domain
MEILMKWTQLTWLVVALLVATGARGQEPQKATDDQSTKTKAEASAQNGASMRLSEVLGAKVSGDDGEILGEITDLVLNPKDGRIQFALLDTEFSDKLLPVPWQALKVSGKDECSMHCKRQKLESAPNIEEEQFSTLESPAYIIRVYEFYEIAPPAGVGGSGQERGIEKGRNETPPNQSPDLK